MERLISEGAFKGTVSRLFSSFVIFPVTLPYALWNLTLMKKLLLSNKIRVSCSTNILPKHYIKRYE